LIPAPNIPTAENRTLALQHTYGFSELRTFQGFLAATKEGEIMDAHFNEYLAAVAAMHEIYGEPGDEHPSEFHEVAEVGTPMTPAEAVALLATG
jgi:hypothetical protein